MNTLPKIPFALTTVPAITSTFKDHEERTPPSNAPGIDFAVPLGMQVIAPAPGRIRGLYLRKLGGRSLFVDHGDGWLTYYAHLQSVWALNGEKVEEGQILGTVGSTGSATGPHLHWALQESSTGRWVDPLGTESPFGVTEVKPIVTETEEKVVLWGMHDKGGEHLMVEGATSAHKGWVLVTEEIGSSPHFHTGGNYHHLTSQGLHVIVRLNYGYGTKGTIPPSRLYGDFAVRCANFVKASVGCHRWIIGNEPNLAWERPGGPGGEKITPELYAKCFLLCRDAIRRQGNLHQVFPAAIGPWNINTGDWIEYFRAMLDLIATRLDGITIHTYTHGSDPQFVYSRAKMNTPGYRTRYWHFKAYQDFMDAIPGTLRNMPVFITEVDQYGPWHDENTGWVQNAYQEIKNWNLGADNQTIHALILYRWLCPNPHDPRDVGWAISDKPGVQADFTSAVTMTHHVRSET